MEAGELIETASAYEPSVTLGTDKNPLSAPMALYLADIPINIHRGMGALRPEDVMVLGTDAALGAVAYCDPYWFVDADARDRALKHHNVLVCPDGESWTIAGKPSVRTRNPETAHVRILLIQLRAQRSGLPAVRI